MTTIWILMPGGALVIGSFMAWRLVRRAHEHAAWLPRFLAVMTFCLGLWVFFAFRMFEGSVRLELIVTFLALYLPMLLAAAWTFAKERQ